MYDLSLLYLPDAFIIDHIRSQDDVAGSGRLLRRAIAVLPACRLGPSRVRGSSNDSFVHLLPRSLLRSVAHRTPTVREPTPRDHPDATRGSRRSRSRLRAVTRQQSKRQRGGVEAFDMVTAGLDAGGRSIGSAVACGPAHRSGSVDPTTRPLERARRDAPSGESLAGPAAVLERPDTERSPSRVRLENAPRTRRSPFRANGLSGETFMSRERIRSHGFDLSGLEATSRVC